LLAMTNRSQHVENCLRGQEQELAEANSRVSQLLDECRLTRERLNSEVSNSDSRESNTPGNLLEFFLLLEHTPHPFNGPLFRTSVL